MGDLKEAATIWETLTSLPKRLIVEPSLAYLECVPFFSLEFFVDVDDI